MSKKTLFQRVKTMAKHLPAARAIPLMLQGATAELLLWVGVAWTLELTRRGYMTDSEQVKIREIVTNGIARGEALARRATK